MVCISIKINFDTVTLMGAKVAYKQQSVLMNVELINDDVDAIRFGIYNQVRDSVQNDILSVISVLLKYKELATKTFCSPSYVLLYFFPVKSSLIESHFLEVNVQYGVETT